MSEPKKKGQVSVVKISVLRVGDTSKVSVVRVHTKDGSATSGEDYHPISEGKYYSQPLLSDCQVRSAENTSQTFSLVCVWGFFFLQKLCSDRETQSIMWRWRFYMMVSEK